MKSTRQDRYITPLQFACFDCRKVFKHEAARYEEHLLPPCPQCRCPMTWMGRAFKAPRSSNIKQWHKVELLARSGFKFWSNAGRYPDTLQEAREFIESRRKLSDGADLSKRISKRTVKKT
ncbi:MAG: hypothetical protein JWM68_3077 [Verrucomicrobiales bacterium]|nr:hypothetical protein [Verrucomicrobiales bacterium]